MQVPGSMLALMFGPRHPASLNRDSHGHIFLDFHPDSFVQILSYLRSKLIEHPDRPALAPVVQPGSQSTFTNLVYYLGLEDFVGLIRFDKASAISMNISKDGHAAKGCITKHVDSQCFAAPAMQRGAVYYLRCTISLQVPKCTWGLHNLLSLRLQVESIQQALAGTAPIQSDAGMRMTALRPAGALGMSWCLSLIWQMTRGCCLCGATKVNNFITSSSAVIVMLRNRISSISLPHNTMQFA